MIVVSMRLLVQTHLGFMAYVSTHPSGFVLYKNEDVFMSIVFTTNYIGLKFVRLIVISAKFIYFGKDEINFRCLLSRFCFYSWLWLLLESLLLCLKALFGSLEGEWKRVLLRDDSGRKIEKAFKFFWVFLMIMINDYLLLNINIFLTLSVLL